MERTVPVVISYHDRIIEMPASVFNGPTEKRRAWLANHAEDVYTGTMRTDYVRKASDREVQDDMTDRDRML